MSLFRRLISEPYEGGDGYAVQRLDLLLDQVMIRSNKRKLPNFPNMKEHNIVWILMKYTGRVIVSWSKLSNAI